MRSIGFIATRLRDGKPLCRITSRPAAQGYATALNNRRAVAPFAEVLEVFVKEPGE